MAPDSPHTPNTPFLPDVEVVVTPYETPPPPPTSSYGRPHNQTSSYVPHTSYTTHGMNATMVGASDPRSTFLVQIEKIMMLEHQVEQFDARLERATRQLNAATKDEPDTMAYLIAAANLAQHAQKDMNWANALKHPTHREPAIQALNKELTSLQQTILTEILESNPEYEMAVANATPGRLLLDIKRSGMYKVRGVK